MHTYLYVATAINLPITKAHTVLYTTCTDGKSNLKENINRLNKKSRDHSSK